MQGEISHTETTEHTGDRELLRRFSLDADEAAFTEIVRRYERLVMSVCRRSLGSCPETDDAFQATFLTLARKPKQIRKIESLSSWLYGVAWRISARLGRARRKNPVQSLPEEQAAVANDPLQQIAEHQHAVILDEELQTLPDKYRDVLVMTYFAEQTSQQIASQLDVSKGTVDGRIRQARNLLRVKLARRGVGVGALFAAATLMQAETAAAAPSVISSTISLGTQTISQSLPGTTDLSHLEPLVRPEITSMIGMKSFLSAVVGVCALAGLAGMGTGQGGALATTNTASVDTREADQDEFATESEPTSVAATETAPGEPIAVSVAETRDSAATETEPERSSKGPFREASERPVALTSYGASPKSFAPYPEDARPTEKWLYETLDSSIKPMEYSEGTPLTEVLGDIAKKYSASDQPMQIWPDAAVLSDEAGIEDLEDVFIGTDIKLENITLQNALNLVLDSLTDVDEPLQVMVKNEVLMITTQVAAGENYFIRTYEVAALMNLEIGGPRRAATSPGGGGGTGMFSVPNQLGGGGGGGSAPAFQPSLATVVMNMTSPPAQWQDFDGEGGTIALVGTKLVVRQNAAVHMEIVKLLNLLSQ